MIDLIDRVLEPSLWFLADWSLRWAVLIVVLAVWLLLVRPRRSATRYLLCVLVLVAGLVLPTLPRWGLSFAVPAAGSNPPAMLAEQPTVRMGSKNPAPASEMTKSAPDGRAYAKDSASDDPARVIEPKPNAEPLGLRRVMILGLAIFWACGVGILLVRRTGGWLLLERLRRTAVPVQATPSQVFQACRAELALRRRVVLASHPMVGSPLTLGLYRPMILVPPSWMESPEQVQRASLLHELAHLARYDDWLALVLESVRVGFFFHPFLHWLLGRIEFERELLCDEAAVAQGIDPRDYAGVLLEFSRRAGRLRPALIGRSYPLGFGHQRTAKIRITRLLEANMKRWMSPLPVGRAVALGTIALGLALGLGSFGLRAVEPQDKEKPTKKPAPVARQQNSTEPQANSQPSEPVPPPVKNEFLRYGGKSFADWLVILMNDLKPTARIDAIKALSTFGANGYGKEAAQAIIECMRGYDFAIHDSDDHTVINAAEAAFRKIGPEGVSALIHELEHGTINGRRFAIGALQYVGGTGYIGSRGSQPPVVPREAAPAVLGAFKDKDAYVRQRALSSMNTHGVDPQRLLSALIEALKDPDWNVRRSAIYKLQQMGQSAKPAVPALIAALKDDNQDVRHYALEVLLKIGVKLPQALPGIVMGLKDQRYSRKPIFEYLEALGPEAKEAVPALIAAFKAHQTDRAGIARVLGNIGPAAKDALPTLIAFMEQKHGISNADAAVQEAIQKIKK
jgi:beta-lactamase regulating signal transducer with metallopeptidase domain